MINDDPIIDAADAGLVEWIGDLPMHFRKKQTPDAERQSERDHIRDCILDELYGRVRGAGVGSFVYLPAENISPLVDTIMHRITNRGGLLAADRPKPPKAYKLKRSLERLYGARH